MISKQFLELLCCPVCKGKLDADTDISELYCVACCFTFPVIHEIPILLPCNVKERIHELFRRYWDSEEKSYVYDKHVEGIDIFGSYNHLSEIAGLTRYYDPTNLDLVLDAGCGNGRFLGTFPRHSLRVGADASLNLLRIAQHKYKEAFLVCCELENLPFRDGLFNTVISCRVLQHLKEQQKAIHELARVTQIEGDIILELYNRWNLKTCYKNIRMSPYSALFNYPFKRLFRSLAPFEPWGLGYDRYNSWIEVKRWLTGAGLRVAHGRGVGFGFHKYLFEPFFINARMSRSYPGLLRSYYDMCLKVEKRIGAWAPFRYFMEKFAITGRKTMGHPRHGVCQWMRARMDDWGKALLYNHLALRETIGERTRSVVANRDNRFHVSEAVGWLKRAQDSTADRGVSRGYSAAWNTFFRSHGWQPSYPETTGYIIPTMFDCAEYFSDPDLRRRALDMADWEMDVQLPSGAVMGGTIDSSPSPSVFNTGQVMLGWLRAYDETDEQKYLVACEKAGKFLVDIQDEDGAWRKGNSLFANRNATTYNSRVGWALVELGQITGNAIYTSAGERSVKYTISMQNDKGWFEKNSLDDAEAPLLHTICYAVEGILGAGLALKKERYVERAKLSAAQLCGCLRNDGHISGRLDRDWHGVVEWACLTGSAQLACIWLTLFSITGEEMYQHSARKIIDFLKTTQNCVSRNEGLRGGIKGSSPFNGSYGKYEVLNWPTKFYIDALLLDEKLA